MYKRITIALVIMLLIGFQVGCSSNESKTPADTAKTKGKSMPYDTPQYNQADLKTFTYPIRSQNDRLVTLETNKGKLVLELYRDVAPNHADSFLARVQDGFYDNTAFHRIIDHFMIQGGGVSVDGKPKTVGYHLNAEFNDLPHQEGTLSAARAADPNSASTQFFVVLERNQSTQSLDHQYTVFGQLIKGYDVLHALGSVAVGPQPYGGENSKPSESVYIVKAYASDAEGNPLTGK
jgi:peptidyl-prolyl cis-trans isomerase B (cyclophilin B)